MMCNASRPSRACPRPEPATVPCPDCGGDGIPDYSETPWMDCPRCKGTGRVPALSETATCRCREPKVDKARPRLCYECGLPVPRHSDAQLDAIVDKVRRA